MAGRYEILNEHGEVVNRIIASPAFVAENFQYYREEVLTEPPEPTFTFAEQQAKLIRAVDQHAAAIRNAIVDGTSPAEMASWPIKRAEAMAWQQSEDANDAPNLSMEADARECSLADLVARVLAKSVALSAIEAQIAGHTGKLQDQIRAVEEGDSAALEAIDIAAGWPEVGA